MLLVTSGSHGNHQLYKVESIIVSVNTAATDTTGHQIPAHSHKCLYWHIFNQNLVTFQ